jgi:hypothetical protein
MLSLRYDMIAPMKALVLDSIIEPRLSQPLAEYSEFCQGVKKQGYENPHRTVTPQSASQPIPSARG